MAFNPFNLLKQKNTANDDYNLKALSDRDLDGFIEGIPTDQVLELRVFKTVVYNDLLARALRASRKNFEKRKLPLMHLVTAAAFGAVDVVRSLLETMERHNPAATELVRRRLKEKAAKW